MAERQGSYFTVRERFESKSRDAVKAAEARQNEVDSLSPELKKIDGLLNATGLRLFEQAMAGKEGLEERVDALRKENERLLKRKAALLKSLGYPEDYTDVRYECEKCRDTGFTGTKMCDCFRKALAKEALENSGLGKLTEKQSFDSFDFSYYSDDKEALENMKLVFNKKYGTLSGAQFLTNYSSEFIATCATFIEMEMTAKDILQVVMPHPTVAEIIREAVAQY